MVILCRVSVDYHWSTFVYFEVIGWNKWSLINCVSLLEVLALVRNVTNLWGLNPLLQISHRLLKYMKWESITKSFFLSHKTDPLILICSEKSDWGRKQSSWRVPIVLKNWCIDKSECLDFFMEIPRKAGVLTAFFPCTVIIV